MSSGPCPNWRGGFQRARLIVHLWHPAPEDAADQRERLAYAMALGKPLRLLLWPGASLPADLCAGYADLQVARLTPDDAPIRQIEAWLAELDAREGEGPHD